MFGHEMFASTAVSSPETRPSGAAADANSSIVLPHTETMTFAPRSRSSGRSSRIHSSTPGPARPTELSMPPPGAGQTRGAGFPGHANAARDLTVTAPRPAGSHRPATSSPWPNVPAAATTGFSKEMGPSATERSTWPPMRERRALKPRASSGRRGGTPEASGRPGRASRPPRCPTLPPGPRRPW